MKNKVKDTLKTAIQIHKNQDLSKEEIIVVSIIIGTLVALIMGYVFGETQYLDTNGERFYAELNVIKKRFSDNTFYTSYAFNYFIGIASFIIISGTSFLFLNRSKTNMEFNKVKNILDNPEHQRVIQGLTKDIQSSLDLNKQNNRSSKNFTFENFMGSLINDHGTVRADLNFDLAKQAWNNVGVNPITEEESKAIHNSFFGPKLPKDIFNNNEK